ncbi:MAG TPA: hypothetical protein VGF96_09520 [Terracidiphilus sp.]|jgi:hypothetical protein
MKRARSLSLLLLLLMTMTMAAYAQSSGSTVTAASCQESAVNAVINGPTHTAANGDTIVIPAGTCTWTSQLSIQVGITLTGSGTPNSSPTTFGAGTPTTIIVDNAGSGNPLIGVSNIPYGQTFALSLLDIEPNSGSTSLWSPVSVAGTCSSSGCPQVRIDNLIFGKTTQWTENGNSSSAGTMVRVDNIFGVADHNTLPNGSQVEFLNASLSAYLGAGGFGDNSWAQPDSLGAMNNFFLENNIDYFTQEVTDQEYAPNGGGIGGGRIVGRFNQLYATAGCWAAFGTHGLDTGGRNRSGRETEAYGNVLTTTNGGCGDAMVAHRGGTGITFGNVANANYTATGGFYNQIDDITVYRTVFAPTPWSYCGGLNSLDPWDTNDNTVYYSGTVTSASTLTMTDSTKTWTTNQLVPNGAPYSIYDTTRGFVSEVASNTATTITVQGPISESGWSGFSNGDSYQVIRSTVCADQAGRGQGIYVSGTAPSPSSPLNEALDPIYEWDDTVANLNHGNFATNTARTISNRDWYTDNSNGSPKVQTSPTSPFNGASGVGFGTLANRPATCTPRVGYFATDQGSWNQSGNSFGQGQLFICTATNQWSMMYQPYTYPHPLTTGGASGGGPNPNPPTNLKGTPQPN